MKDKDIDKVYGFIREINKFKQVDRLALIKENGRSESDAEHTWHLCMAVWLYSGYYEKKIDTFKAIKLALVHDLVEIYSGDYYGGAVEKDREGKKQKELEASKKLFGQLPDKIKTEFEDLWLEYEKRESEEAKFVWALDKIAPRLQLSITKTDKASNLSTDWDKVNKQDEQIRNTGKILDKILTKVYNEPNFNRAGNPTIGPVA